jgi:hypothetical protein
MLHCLAIDVAQAFHCGELKLQTPPRAGDQENCGVRGQPLNHASHSTIGSMRCRPVGLCTLLRLTNVAEPVSQRDTELCDVDSQYCAYGVPP